MHAAPAQQQTESLVQSVRAMMDRHGFNQLDVMRDSGVSNSVLCLWLQRKYKGDNQKVAQRLQNWMASVRKREESRKFSAHPDSAAVSPMARTTSATSSARAPAPTVPLYAYAPQSSYGHGSSSKHSQHVSHEHLVPIRLQHTLTPPSRARKQQQQQQQQVSSLAVPPSGSSSVGASYSDCFLWNLFEQQLSPRAFLAQTLADQGLDASVWMSPLLSQFKSQLARYVATEPQRKENQEEWPALLQHYGLPPNNSHAAPPPPAPVPQPPPPPPAIAPMAPPALETASAPAPDDALAALAAASSSFDSDTPRRGSSSYDRDVVRDTRVTPSAVQAADNSQCALPTFVCGAVSSVPILAAMDPANNTPATTTGGDGSGNRSTSDSSMDGPPRTDTTGTTSAASTPLTASTATSGGSGGVNLNPDTSLLHQRPAGDLTRQSAPQLLKLKFDVTHGGTRLLYHVLWDPLNPYCIPEDMARCICKELGLGGDMAALLAWQAREQLAKDAALQAKGMVEGCIGRVPFPPPGDDLFRTEAASADFGPIVCSVHDGPERHQHPASTTADRKPNSHLPAPISSSPSSSNSGSKRKRCPVVPPPPASAFTSTTSAPAATAAVTEASPGSSPSSASRCSSNSWSAASSAVLHTATTPSSSEGSGASTPNSHSNSATPRGDKKRKHVSSAVHLLEAAKAASSASAGVTTTAATPSIPAPSLLPPPVTVTPPLMMTSPFLAQMHPPVSYSPFALPATSSVSPPQPQWMSSAVSLGGSSATPPLMTRGLQTPLPVPTLPPSYYVPNQTIWHLPST